MDCWELRHRNTCSDFWQTSWRLSSELTEILSKCDRTYSQWHFVTTLSANLIILSLPFGDFDLLSDLFITD